MFRIHVFAMASCAVVALTLAAGDAKAGSTTAPSTGNVSGDWDIDTDTYNARLGQEPSLGDVFFRVQWTSEVDRQGQSRITGYVYDDYGEAADNVQLRITMVDATGHEMDSVIRPVRGTIPAEGSAYFDVLVPQGPTYRVSVVSFDFVEGAKGK
jgi:hypothetical protein